MNLGDLNKVWEIKTLKRKEKEDEAKNILERIALQIQPIMRKHNWRVKLLSEFCPKNPALLGLNVNRGVHVKLRLRRPNRDTEFYPFHQVLDTMLHELCHNAHGPHNSVFYKLWDDLRKECEELIHKGISGSGEGFDLPGRRLGGISQPANSSLRHTTLIAAQKRARLGSLLPTGPKRLGGDNSMMAALSPVQAAAMAAERRLQDEIWCASGSCDIEEGEINDEICGSESSRHSNKPDVNISVSISRKRSRELCNNDSSLSRGPSKKSSFVDLTSGSSVSRSVCLEDYACHTSGLTNTSSQFMNRTQNNDIIDLGSDALTSAPTLDQDAINYAADSLTWECSVCTLMNPALALVCEACSAVKDRDIKDKYKFWSCKFCTLENNVDIEKCMACNEWRYSYGGPVAACAPHIGT